MDKLTCCDIVPLYANTLPPGPYVDIKGPFKKIRVMYYVKDGEIIVEEIDSEQIQKIDLLTTPACALVAPAQSEPPKARSHSRMGFFIWRQRWITKR